MQINREATLHRLHDMLAERPGGADPLAITTEPGETRAEEASVRVSTPDGSVELEQTGETTHMLMGMTQRQRRAVTINGTPVPQMAMPGDPSVERWHTSGYYLAEPESVRSSGTITIEGVSYRAGPQDPADKEDMEQAPFGGFRAREAFHAPAVQEPQEPTDDRPRYEALEVWRVAHNMIAHEAGPAEAHGSRLVMRGGVISCWPSQAIRRNLPTQLAASRARAAKIAGRHEATVTFSEEPQGRGHGMPELWNANDGHVPVTLSDLATPVTMDRTMPKQVRYTVGREITRRDHQGLVPLQGHRARGLPTLTVEEITIQTADGDVWRINIAEQEAEGWEQTPAAPTNSLAQAITAKIRVGEQMMDIPVRLATLGRSYEEVIWRTADYDQGEDGLSDELFEAYWDPDEHHDVTDESASADYGDWVSVLATQIVEGDDAALEREIEITADNLRPKARNAQVPIVAGRGTQAIAWIPLNKLDDDLRAAACSPAGLAIGVATGMLFADREASVREEIYHRALRQVLADDTLETTIDEMALQAEERTAIRLRPYQAEIVAALADSLEKGRPHIQATMTAGQGRTLTAAATAAEVARRMPTETVFLAVPHHEMLETTAHMVRDLTGPGPLVTISKAGAKPHGNVVIALTSDIRELVEQTDGHPTVIFAGGRRLAAMELGRTGHARTADLDQGGQE